MGQSRPYLSERPRLSRRTTVFLACLGLSAFLWLLRALSQNYEETIPLEVVFTGLPEDRIVINELPQRIEMQVEAMGFEVLWQLVRPFSTTLTIDLSKAKLRKVNHAGTSMQCLLTEIYRDNADALLSSSIKVTHLLPDTLYFNIAPRQSKKVPVKLAGELTYDDDAAPSGEARITPAKVTVFGPKELLTDLLYIETEDVNWSNIGENISATIGLKSLADARLMSMDVKEVEVKLDVIAVESKQWKVPVTIVGKLAAQRWTPAPEEVTITVKATRERLDKLSSESFAFSVNTADVKEGERVKVKCDKRADGIADLRWTPMEVELEVRK